MSTPKGWLDCRTFGHAMDPRASKPGDEQPGLTPIRVECVRCHTVRLDQVDTRGEVVSRRYTWPPGYRLAKEDPRLTRAQYRQHFIKRLQATKQKASTS